MSSTSIYYIIIVILIADYIFEQSLDLLNLKHQKTSLPPELQGIYDQEKLEKARAYFNVNARFSFLTSGIQFVVVLAIVALGIFGTIDTWLSDRIGNEIVRTLAFFGLIFLASDILGTPASLYRTFVIEEKFGFNRTTLKTYLLDKLKGYLLTAIVGGGICYLLLFLIFQLQQNFWIWFWIVVAGFLVLVNMLYASVIVPMFNKLTPLEEGDLRSKIEEFSQKISFPLKNIYVIDGSKRSNKANAYFSGIGSQKKIVLFDTLINNHTHEEIVAVLAHEVGHYKKKHILIGLILSVLQVGLILFILSRFVFNEEISKALGAQHLSYGINLIAFGILFSPISHLIGVFMNMFSRKNEYEADNYAAVNYSGKPLQEALKKLSVNNLSNLNPHPAYVFVHYSHPPLLARLRAMGGK